MADPGTAGLGPRIRSVVLDVADLDRAAAFWSALLETPVERRDDRYAWLADRPGDPRLVLQAVPEPKTCKARSHVDLVAADAEALVARATALGARLRERIEEPGYELAVLADPDGNEFCVVLRESGG